MSRRYPGLSGMMRLMFRDHPEDYRDPEEIDAEVDAEKEEEQEDDPTEVVDVIPVGSEREKEELRDAEETLWDVRFGIAVLSALCLIGLFFVKQRIRYAAGVCIGCLLALFLITEIYKSISLSLMLEPDRAVRYARKKVIARYFVSFGVLAATMFFGGIYMGAGTILASFTIKPAAYFQPWFRKLKRRLFKKEVNDT